MTNETKRNKAIKELVDKNKNHELKEAITILKKGPETKFDQTIEFALDLELDQATNPIRGMVSLPHGTGKKTKVAVFCKGDFEKQATEAGADFVGSDELMKKVADGWVDFDIAVTTPDMMRDMAKLGKVLGPRGLMPNPKSGTVTTEIAKTVKELKAGKIEYRMDKQSGVRVSVGKMSFSVEALAENILTLLKAVVHSTPKLQKIDKLKSIAISSTMGAGIKLDRNQFKDI